MFIADGSHVSMPDTPENQAAYPQPPQQEPGLGFPLARLTVLLSLATGACHDLAIAAYEGKGTGETTLLRALFDALKPGDVILADALFDNYFLVCDLRARGIDLVARAQYQRVGSQTAESRPDGDILVWQRPNKPHGMKGEQYRRYPKTLRMRQVAVDARGQNNRAEQFHVITTILDASIGGGSSATCTSGGGAGRWISARSNRRCGWTSCAARRRRWSRRRSGRTCWRTTCCAR